MLAIDEDIRGGRRAMRPIRWLAVVGTMPFLLACDGDGGAVTGSAPSAAPEMVTETFEGDLRDHWATHPFSMSEGGDVTITVLEFSTPWPESDKLSVAFCCRIDPDFPPTYCVALDFCLPRDLNGEPPSGLVFYPQQFRLPYSHTWRLPPSHEYGLGVVNGLDFYGPEFTYKIALTHPR
jgi:hypothetical protein